MKLLILDTFFVILLGLVHHTQPSRITNAPTNFRNLFLAQSENNVRKTEGDRKIMEQEIANNQKVFNILKNELQHLRERPAKKQKYNVRRNRDTSKEAPSESQNGNAHAENPKEDEQLSTICIKELCSSKKDLGSLGVAELGYVIGKMDEKYLHVVRKYKTTLTARTRIEVLVDMLFPENMRRPTSYRECMIIILKSELQRHGHFITKLFDDIVTKTQIRALNCLLRLWRRSLVRPLE